MPPSVQFSMDKLACSRTDNYFRLLKSFKFEVSDISKIFHGSPNFGKPVKNSKFVLLTSDF